MPTCFTDTMMDRNGNEMGHYLVAPVRSLLADGPAADNIRRILDAARLHLGMDVAFPSEFVARRRIFREVRSASTAVDISPGDSDPLEKTYCRRGVDGRLPQLMPDARCVSAVSTLPTNVARYWEHT